MRNANVFWLSLIRFANGVTRKNRTVRRLGIGLYRSAIRANQFLPPPRVLLNGPPKSGTHLLSNCLSLLPKMMFSGRHFAFTDFLVSDISRQDQTGAEAYPEVDRQRLASFLSKCPQGMFVTAHARFHPALTSLIDTLDFKHIFLLRDPRDVAVSHVFYVKREPLHDQYTYFNETLSSDHERLMVTIRNFGSRSSNSFPLRSEFDTFAGSLPWLNHPATLVVRFEDLIGSQGGGSHHIQVDTIRKIGAFVERPLDEDQAYEIAEKMYGKSSSTFRKGQIGDWRNHFTAAHRQAFKEVMGDRLIKLGYEKDMNW